MNPEPLTLRPLEREHLDSRVRWINDPAISRFVSFRPTSLAKTEAWFQECVRNPDRSDFSVIADDRLVGMAGLLDIDLRNRSAEMYVTIGETDMQGRGLGRRASNEVLSHGFEMLGLHRIYLKTFADNRRARSLYESLGFALEGVQRQASYSRGAFRDVALYAILRLEWERRGSGS